MYVYIYVYTCIHTYIHTWIYTYIYNTFNPRTDPVPEPRGLGRQFCRGPQRAHGFFLCCHFRAFSKARSCLVVSMGEVQASNVHALILGDLLLIPSSTSCCKKQPLRQAVPSPWSQLSHNVESYGSLKPFSASPPYGTSGQLTDRATGA